MLLILIVDWYLKKNMKELPIHSVNGAQDQDPGK